MYTVKLMRNLALLLIVFIFSACTRQETREALLPPLSALAPLIRTGMSEVDVTKTMTGHKPFLRFTDINKDIWEFHERINDPRSNIINENKLLLRFDTQGKVSEINTSYCLIPDQEPAANKSPATRCYQKHLFPFEKKTTYDAIKRLLIVSNYQVEHSDAASEIISASGVNPIPDDPDKIMFLKVSIIFTSPKQDVTEVVMAANFSVSEKQSTWVQAGFAGVTLPVPLPFLKKEEWIETGIVTPKFYMEFYDALSRLIANEYYVYKPHLIDYELTTSNISHQNPVSTDAAVKLNRDTVKMEIDGQYIQKEILLSNSEPAPIDSEEDKFHGQPIDSTASSTPRKKSTKNVSKARLF